VRCPFCGHGDTKVLDSRPTEEGSAVRRRRECEACGRRFTTYEKMEDMPLYVIKKDGRREAFDRRKVLGGLLRACEKRPLDFATLEKLAADVERVLYSSLRREVHSREIGELVMERLAGLDEVAFVRFASVYRQFKDVGRFMDEVVRLLERRDGTKTEQH
jgi:transcriptional repressor NrdR